ncbi:MAG: DUF883 domain-containing protein [Legionella sp.]|nr:DUF883 domain-containing protein [Legionella sp.]
MKSQNDMNKILNKTASKVAEEGLNDVYNEGTKNFNNAAGTGKDKTESMTEHLKSKASELYEDGKHKMHDLEHSLSDYSQELMQLIKNQPLTSVLIAGAAGFLLAKLFHK